MTEQKLMSKINDIMMSSKLLVTVNLCCREPAMQAKMNSFVQQGLKMTLHVMQRLAAEGAAAEAAQVAAGEGDELVGEEEEWVTITNEFVFSVVVVADVVVVVVHTSVPFVVKSRKHVQTFK